MRGRFAWGCLSMREGMLMFLKRVTIHKFKCVESDQSFDVDPEVTVLVGMNESGKTSILQALAKTNYFENDPEFRFNATHDFPRKEKKRLDKSGKTAKAVTCIFGISPELRSVCEDDLGPGVFTADEVATSIDYENKTTWGQLEVDSDRFIAQKTEELGIASKTLQGKLHSVNQAADFQALLDGYQDEALKQNLEKLRRYFTNEWNWPGNPLGEYVAHVLLAPRKPKFLYYDEYYALPSRISIEKLQGDGLESEDLKTAKALFDLADINVDELLDADDFEDYKAELEATEATITQELFNYWSTNKNLEIQFDIDKIEKNIPEQGTRIVEHVLDVRVRNTRTKISLPLRHRSKGFNWFFSFLVWFKRIQEDASSDYVLLLDEPGLSLHASAQHDLLDFIESLCGDYQILYTTHSPFMVKPDRLDRVRTILETNDGSVISDSVQEKDPQTLFPLQAALGYDIAQNLFIAKHNLLVEGVSDLAYLQTVSGMLSTANREGLRDDVVIVPVGGMDKVSTFVSLFRGNSLNLVCLLDSTVDAGSKARLDDLVAGKIIQKSKVLRFQDFVDDGRESDIEDLFEPKEYLALFNRAFPDRGGVKLGDLDSRVPRIVAQIAGHLGIPRFNHYLPACEFVVTQPKLSPATLDRFEAVFKKVNGLA